MNDSKGRMMNMFNLPLIGDNDDNDKIEHTYKCLIPEGEACSNEHINCIDCSNYAGLNKKHTIDNLPKYVKLYGGCALRLTSKNIYYRDAGRWSVPVEILSGKILVKKEGERTSHLVGKHLVPITEKEWRRDNDGYIE